MLLKTGGLAERMANKQPLHSLDRPLLLLVARVWWPAHSFVGT